MKKNHRSFFYHFLFASLLSGSAQSFFLAPHLQGDLLSGISSSGTVSLSVLFLNLKIHLSIKKFLP